MKASAILLFLAGAASAAPLASPDEACRALLAKAQLVAPALTCAPAGEELSVAGASCDAARASLFPEGLFLGRMVRIARTAARRGEAASFGVLSLPAFFGAAPADVNFDGSVLRTGDAALPAASAYDVASDTGTPPGSGGNSGPGGGGPPGSGGNSGPPGSGGNSGPPGSGGNTGPGGSNPPGSGGNSGPGGGQSNPPSKPIPVAPAPPPAWWNTASVTTLNGPLTSWGSDYYDANTGEGYTRWYPWSKYFYSSTRSNSPAYISRSAANAAASYTVTPTSQEKTETRECYYQAYYTWNSYEGRWDFDHYKGACAVINTSYAPKEKMAVSVEFDMKGFSFLPWEKETIGLSYDGSKVGVDLSGAAFNYAVGGPIVDQGNGTATVKLTAVSRVKRSPEKDKVNINLQKNGAKLQLVVKDDRASYYAGEVLQVKVKVKKDSGHWYKADPVIVDQTLNIKVNTNQSQTTTFDVPASGSGEYYIKEWSFRRENSKISTGEWIPKGSGNRIKY